MFYTGDQIVIFKVSKLVHAYICTKFCFSGLSSGERVVVPSKLNLNNVKSIKLKYKVRGTLTRP